MGSGLRIGIIGCGLIGTKRAKHIINASVVACADHVMEKSIALASSFAGCQALNSWQSLVAMPDIDVVIIATPHHMLAPIAISAIKAKKHLLIEKPGARTSSEILPLIKLAKENNVIVHVGFNHRYHRALQKAHDLVQSGALGELMFIRARYGHGGRIGYEKEWRAQPELSGGGELLDQGIHLIDLSRWFMGDFEAIEGFAHTYYWDMPVDDNGFLLLKTKTKQVAFLHASCTEWKNTFSMEIFGKKAKIAIEGLGGSYGVEKLTWYKMLPEMGPPETTSFEYPMEDNSWKIEWLEFMDDIRLIRAPASSLIDAYEALKIVETIYAKQVEGSHDHHAQPA